MIPNMHMFCVIYVSLSVTTCEAEISFSTLRRIYTFMRNSQSQERLNHCSTLAIHRELTIPWKLINSSRSSLIRVPQRKNEFGPNPNRFSFMILFSTSAIQLNNRVFINTINDIIYAAWPKVLVQ